jgi:hypothetical protein
MMAKRGRKPRKDVERYPSGQIKQETLLMPYNTAGVIVTGDERTRKGLMRVQTVLEVLVLPKSEKLAGEELGRLKELCRRYYLGAPRPSPKIASMEPGHGHEGDLTAEVVDLGEKFMKKYSVAVERLRREGRGVIPIVCAVCFENKMPTSEERPLLRRGLKALADLWGLNVK